MKLILKYIRRHIRMFLTAIFFLTLETIAELLQPTFMSYIVDKGVKSRSVDWILLYGGIMLGIAALGALGAVMRNIYASRTSQRIGKEMRSEIYGKIQTLSFENIDRLQPASLITRITNDVTQIQNFINGSMRIMMKVPIICVGAITLIILQTPQQLPVLLVIICISGVLIWLNMRLGYPRFGRMQGKLDRLNEVSREFLSSIRVVKAFHAEEQEEEKFAEASGEFAAAGISAMRVLAVFSPLINLTVNLGIVILLLLSGRQDAGEIGKLMASINYMTQVLFALGMITHILNSAVRAVASSKRVEEVLREEPAQKLPLDPVEIDIKGEIAFLHTTFSYDGTSMPALEDISFTVNPGETIGIIGPTGSGKSTLVNLIPRFYDPTKGEVRIDGSEIRQIGTDLLRHAISVVPQKALLFSGTIAQNLRWGKEDATDEELQTAIRIACADEFISGFPAGLDTRLNQGGVNLSGGQKQRLSIARALMRRPKILILDDCTSALDASTEAEVLKALEEEVAHMTVLLISQRISTVMNTDRVLCMEEGQIRGFGTHEDLLESCPAYQAIYQSQIGGEQNG